MHAWFKTPSGRDRNTHYVCNKSAQTIHLVSFILELVNAYINLIS